MNETPTLAPATKAQIDDVPLEAGRPLLIVDADEVLVVFMAAFEAFLAEQDLYFDWAAFRLTGSVRRRADRQPISAQEVTDTLDRFYQARTALLDPVPGAAAALDQLRRHAQIVVLTNLPIAYKSARAEGLARHGMNYPLLVNTGPKGPAVQLLARRAAAPSIFVDDSPRHHESVADLAGHVHRIHFVHDPRLAELAGPARASHRHDTEWPETRDWIESVLAGDGG